MQIWLSDGEQDIVSGMTGKVLLLRPVRVFLLSAVLAVAPRVAAQDLLLLSLHPEGSWQVVERTDVRRYDTGRYVGLTSREVRGLLGSDRDPSSHDPAEPAVLRGVFLVLEETRRDRREAARRISESVPAEIELAGDGSFAIGAGDRFPVLPGISRAPRRSGIRRRKLGRPGRAGPRPPRNRGRSRWFPSLHDTSISGNSSTREGWFTPLPPVSQPGTAPAMIRSGTRRCSRFPGGTTSRSCCRRMSTGRCSSAIPWTKATATMMESWPSADSRSSG